MADDFSGEIRSLKEAISRIQERIRLLEQKASPTPSTASASAPQPKQAASPRPAAAGTLAASNKPAVEALETKIGRDWLNKIGITSLVLGVVFFILYTFQYFGPAIKIATGFAIGSGLVGLGVWLEKRPSLKWYAFGLIGGGWSLVYFTTYAMYHIPLVRIVTSAQLDLFLLLAVATGAVSHSLKYQSEAITALALLLGFITTSVSNVTYFTLASSVLLVGALSWIVVRMRWHGLYLYGVLASYLTYLFWIEPQIRFSQVVAVRMASAADAEFWLKAGFVGLYWAAYNAVLFAFDEKELKQRNRLLSATLVNGLFFVQTTLLGMDPLYREFRYLFLLVVGGLYAASEPFVRAKRMPAVATAHLLLGLSLMTLAIPLKLTDHWVSFLWTGEVAFFVWMGLRYNRWSYRLFAAALAALVLGRLLLLDIWNSAAVVILGWSVPWRVLMGCIGIASFGLAAAAYRLPLYRLVIRAAESQAFHFYFFASAALMWLLMLAEISTRWLVAAWMTQAAGVVLLGFRLRDAAMRLAGVIGYGISALLAVSLMWVAVWQPRSVQWNAWSVAVAIALAFLLSWRYRSMPEGKCYESEKSFGTIYAIGATLLLTALLWVEISRQWLSIAWAAEGLLLVAAGFVLRERIFRFCGLGVFGLLVAKILLVDMAGAETVYRILSFIVAGVILLAASFAYARFTGKPVLTKKSS